MEYSNNQSSHSALLTSVAYDLRLPLLQIQTKLELLGQKGSYELDDLAQLGLSATSGLHLLEAYIVSTSHQTRLALEPVSVSAMLEEAAHTATAYARHYSTTFEIQVGRLQPVLADRQTATLGFTCLLESLVRAQASQNTADDYRLVLGAHRAAGQVVAGVYGAVDNLTGHMLRSARQLAGRAHEPLSSLAASSSSGILLADKLFERIGSPLRTSRHHNQQGLAAVFASSKQLPLL